MFLKSILRNYKVQQCRSGTRCSRKNTCNNWHNENERRRPSYIDEKTGKPNYDFVTKCEDVNCKYDQCKYYHNEFEKKYHISLYKTKLCNNQNCYEYCAFAHGKDDLRKKQCKYGEKCTKIAFCPFWHSNNQLKV